MEFTHLLRHQQHPPTRRFHSASQRLLFLLLHPLSPSSTLFNLHFIGSSGNSRSLFSVIHRQDRRHLSQRDAVEAATQKSCPTTIHHLHPLYQALPLRRKSRRVRGLDILINYLPLPSSYTSVRINNRLIPFSGRGITENPVYFWSAVTLPSSLFRYLATIIDHGRVITRNMEMSSSTVTVVDVDPPLKRGGGGGGGDEKVCFLFVPR